MTRYVYIGGSTQPSELGRRGAGIAVYRMASVTGRLDLVQEVDSEQDPAFLALHPNSRWLYAINEVREGKAAAFALDAGSGRLAFLNRAPLNAPGPCYVTVSPDGRWLASANYGGGSLSILPVLEDGRLGQARQVVQHEGSSASGEQPYIVIDDRGMEIATLAEHSSGPGAMPDRQEKPHTHSAIFDPEYRFLLAADLGMDRVWAYRFDSDDGRVLPVGEGQAGGFNARPGAGPRHMVFHPNGRVLYVANELDSTVLALAWDAETGSLAEIQAIRALPEGFEGVSWAADIHLTPDGRFLYVSNRGDDTLACFAVAQDSGRLTPAGHFSTGGHWPRNFGISPDGQFLLAANQMSDSVVVFRIDQETGALAPTGAVIETPAAMCVLIVDLPAQG